MKALQTPETWHDHTPLYTEALGKNQGESVTVRLATHLKPKHVQLLVNVHGEMNYLPAQKMPHSNADTEWYSATLPLPSYCTRYAWVLECEQDTWFYSRAGLTHSHRGYRDFFQYLAGYHLPEWVYSACFYQIFPDRFKNGNPENDVTDGEYFYQGRHVVKAQWQDPINLKDDVHAHYGGDLEGITEALPYLKNLGVNALWLTPIFSSPSNHKYDTSDYFAIDPHFGGEEAFDALIQHSRSAGIKIVLDGVFNHVGADHALFAQALENEHAPSREVFTWNSSPLTPEQENTLLWLKKVYITKEALAKELQWQDVEAHIPHLTYAAFFGVPSLPKINYGSAQAFDHFIDGANSVVRHWIRKGAAGWRLDVAHQMGKDGTDEGNVQVHERLKIAAREENPEAYVFGERSFDSEYALTGKAEDGVMNYHGFCVPFTAWLSGADMVFRPVNMPTSDLIDLLWDAYMALPPQVALAQYNLLDSHDYPRMLYRLNGDTEKLKTALVMLYAYAGVPAIYYGTEIALSQTGKGAMPHCRTSMPWDEAQWNMDVLAFTQKLIALRKSEIALQQGSLRFMAGYGDVLGFERQYNGERIVALISRTPETHSFPLQGQWQNLISGEMYSGQFSGYALLKAIGN